MAKIETSEKQKRSAKRYLKAHTPFASKELKSSKLVVDTLLDCIRTGDLDTFREVLIAHLLTRNKTGIAKKAGIGRRTLYDLIDPEKEFNPALTTVSSVLRAIAS